MSCFCYKSFYAIFFVFRRKNKMTKKLGTNSIDERRLFHGTQLQYLDPILKQGFDWRISGSSTGTMYGKGSYFARDSSYSTRYAHGSNCMLVVKVLVGRFTNGSTQLTRPPPISASDPHGDLYDTCVDSTSDPSIFVTFEREQAYPEYLIEF